MCTRHEVPYHNSPQSLLPAIKNKREKTDRCYVYITNNNNSTERNIRYNNNISSISRNSSNNKATAVITVTTTAATEIYPATSTATSYHNSRSRREEPVLERPSNYGKYLRYSYPLFAPIRERRVLSQLLSDQRGEFVLSIRVGRMCSIGRMALRVPERDAL